MKYLIAFLVLMCITPLHAEDLPLVEERYDQVWIVRIEDRQQETVYFIRDNKLIATRTIREDMLWTAEGEDFVLIWADWVCHRIIKFKTFASVRTPTCDAINKTRAGPWWAMARPMTDLKQPERQP